ncbi:hypothetical protein [Kitasatospora viridis]|uniref:Uncharacterized protein n=1 Tax=Kitasatospora viridis TaxID=281105 RepID=A0A561T6U8_9ACTN|nr:hypothetical protein [Kitasatospora viridis]TWF82819.1 hypothetical protein FHX73_14301 [Kitasatospora viridis]
MAPACPQCASPDHAVPVPQILTDPSIAPDARAPLAPPPAPQQDPVRQSTAATVLFSIGGALGVLGLFTEIHNSSADLSGYSDAYRTGYAIGPFVLPVILLVIALVLRSRSLARGQQAAAQLTYGQQMRWQQLQRVWQSGWLCRGCGVTFFPLGAVGPDSDPSPAIAPGQYHLWVATAVDRSYA